MTIAEDDDAPAEVDVAAVQAEAETGVAVDVTVSLGAVQAEDVIVPIELRSAGEVLASDSITVAAGEASARLQVGLPEGAVAEGDVISVALGDDLPGTLQPGERASVDVTIELPEAPANPVNLTATQVEQADRVALSVTVSLVGQMTEDVSVPVTVSAAGAGAGDYLATADVVVAAGDTSGTATIDLPEGSVGDADTVRVALGELPEGLVAGDSAAVSVTIALAPMVPDVEHAVRWWNVLDGDRKEAALYGGGATEEQAAGARRMYAELGAEAKSLVNRAASELYGGGAHGSVGEWWQTLDCRLRRVAVGDGNEADASSAYCADYPGSGSEGVLGGDQKALVDKAGLALLGRTDIGVYPPAALSIADASTREGPDAVLEFAVSLSEPATGSVRVNWTTIDGTATAGADYTAASGTLEIMPGDTSASIRVLVLEDGVDDESDETLTVRLSNANGARLSDGEALGTIQNLQAPPAAWLGRFGRTVSEQLLEGIGDRVASKRRLARTNMAQQPAGSGTTQTWSEAQDLRFEATIGGRRVGTLFAGNGQQVGIPGPMLAEERPLEQATNAHSALMSMPREGGLTLFGTEEGLESLNDGAADNRQPGQSRNDIWRTMLSGSSFELGGNTSGSANWGVWGRGAYTRFEGSDSGTMLDGDVSTGQLGADWTTNNWIVGLSLSHSVGDGDYQGVGGSGDIESTMTAVTPYVSYGTDKFSVWAAMSRGEGELTLSPDLGASIDTDIEMDMVAVGVRNELLTRPNGFGLAVLSDVMSVETSSDAVSEMPGTSADATRIRLALEGSLTRSLADGGLFSASLEGGVRQDNGDLEEGLGGEIAGTLSWSQGGLTFEIEGRGMMTHEDEDFMQTGASAYLAWDAQPSTSLGPSVSLRQQWGIDTASGIDQLFGMPNVGDYGYQHDVQSLDAEFSWGLPALSERYVATAYLKHGMRANGQVQGIGWRLQPIEESFSDLSFVLSASRRESARLPADHGIGIKIISRW